MSMLQRKHFWLLAVPLVLLLTVAAAHASAPAALTSGLVAQYSFEGNADDSSGNGNDGTQIGAISYAPGQCGQAAVFDGPGSGEYIQVPAHSLQDWTVTAWFQETRDTGTWQRVWDFGSSQGGGGAFFLATNHGRRSSQIGVGVHQSGGALVLDLGTGIVPPVGTWHHVAVTYDKGGAGMSIYVDGTLSSSAGYNAQSFDDFSNQTWWIAKSNWAADPLFQGLIDELYIYNRVLDPAEIQDLATPTCGQIDVQIDIKPGSDSNCFNNDGLGVIPVAILGSASFDVTEVDASTVVLEGMAVKAVGKSNKLLAHIEDVNSDGFDDLVVKIEDEDMTFSPGDTAATLTGNLLPDFGSTPIEGTDTICIVP